MRETSASQELRNAACAAVLARGVNFARQFSEKLALDPMPANVARYLIREAGAVPQVLDTEVSETPARKPGNSDGGRSLRSHSASDAQLGYARKLILSELTGDEQAGALAKIEGGCSWKTASAIIDTLAGKKEFRMSQQAVTHERMASDKQIAFLEKLITERGKPIPWLVPLAALTADQASDFITNLLRQPKVAQAAPTATQTAELESGIYRHAGVVYKVQRAVHGSGGMYAKALVVDEPTKAHFEYAKGAIRNITADDKMDLDECKKYGAIYGVCIVCGATLTDEKSISAGIGPICASKV